jgi:cell division protein FtsB
MEAINADGAATCSKEMLAALEAEIAALEAESQKHEQSVASFAESIKTEEAKLKTPIPFDQTDKYGEINRQIKTLRESESQPSANATRIAMLEKDINDLRAKNDALSADKAKLAFAEQQRQRIEALEADEKRLAGEFENLQRGVFLCEEFIKAKVSMLTDKINGRFESVRFRLFIEQINGGIKEDCEIMIPSEDGAMVPYTTANNAARINAGLEIIDALARHWGVSVPIFVDNAESVTRLKQIDGQLIRLVVSEADKTLRTEAA